MSAHTIRTPDTKQFEALTALQAVHHWCLTGTPISNKVEDLGALLRFCRVPLLEDRKCFRNSIAKPTKRSLEAGCGIVRKALTPICLRRTRASIGIVQPSPLEYVVNLTDDEKAQRRVIIEDCKSRLGREVGREVSSGKRHTVLQSILRLRLFCNHGTLYPIQGLDEGIMEENMDVEEFPTVSQSEEVAYCVTCCSEVPKGDLTWSQASDVTSECSHVLCSECYGSMFDDGEPGVLSCPVCDETGQTEMFDLSTSRTQRQRIDPHGHSAKLQCLVDDINAHSHEKR